MALIVEDGSIVAGAESFVDVAYTDAYWAARVNIPASATWAAADQAHKESALRQATAYMEQNYRTRWRSFRVSSVQALSWPRAWVQLPDSPYGYGSFAAFIPNNVVPDEVKKACAELAGAALAGELNPVLDRLTTSEKVGDIAVTYDQNSPQYKRYRNVDMMLSPFLSGSGMSRGLVRA